MTSENQNSMQRKSTQWRAFFVYGICWFLFLYVELLFCCDVVFLLSCFSVAISPLCFGAVWLFCGFVAIERSRCAVSVKRRAARRTGFVGGAVLCAAILAFDHFHFHAFGERNARLDF